MATASTVPAAKAAILTLLQSSTVLGAAADPVQVAWAHPGASIAQESVYMGGVQLDQAPHTSGQRIRESYLVEIIVDVALDGDDPQAAETRMWALVAGVEACFDTAGSPARKATTLGGAVNLWAVVETIEQTPYLPGGGQRLSEAVIGVRCESYK